jgi:hypothetical protein
MQQGLAIKIITVTLEHNRINAQHKRNIVVKQVLNILALAKD